MMQNRLWSMQGIAKGGFEERCHIETDIGIQTTNTRFFTAINIGEKQNKSFSKIGLFW
jgi:hypothetical protein